MADDAGFKLDGEFYPWPDFQDDLLNTSVIVEIVTGMVYQDFIDMAEISKGDRISTTVMQGMMAAAIHQKRPDLTGYRIKALLKPVFDANYDGFEFVAAEEEPEGAEVVQLPPPAGEGQGLSESLSEKSTDEADPQNSDVTGPTDSGSQTSQSTTA